MTIELDIPGLKERSISEEHVREMLVVHLYREGIVSSLHACELLRKRRREFEELLERYGIAPMPDTDEDIENELSQGSPKKGKWARVAEEFEAEGNLDGEAGEIMKDAVRDVRDNFSFRDIPFKQKEE